jgi:hypothetical protein
VEDNMGFAKREMEDRQAAYDEGLALCIEAGAISECEYHEGTYFQGQEEVVVAYRLAARRVAAGEIAGPQGEVTDAVKAAYDDNSGVDSCMQCDKNYERD